MTTTLVKLTGLVAARAFRIVSIRGPTVTLKMSTTPTIKNENKLSQISFQSGL